MPKKDSEVTVVDVAKVIDVEPDPFPAAPPSTGEEGKEGALYDLLWGRADRSAVKLGLDGGGYRLVHLSRAEAVQVQEDPRWSNLNHGAPIGGHERDPQHGLYLGTIGDVAFFVAPEV